MKLKLFFAAMFLSVLSYAQNNFRWLNFTTATTSGTDTYTLTVTNYTAYHTGDYITVKFGNANTGSSTLNINSLGAISIKKSGTSNIASGDISASEIRILEYDGTNFQLLGGNAGGGLSSGLTAGHIFVGDVSNVAQDVAMSGDATLSSTGALSIGAGKVTNTMLAGSIAYSKLSLTGAVVDGDLATSYIKADGTRAFTGDQSLGGFKLTNVKELDISGTAGTGFVNFVAQSSNSSAPSSTGFNLFAGSTGNLRWVKKNGTDTYVRGLVGTLTADHDYTLPDWTGNVIVDNGNTVLSGPTTLTGSSTNILKAVFNSLGTTSTDGVGLYFQNSTAAAAGAQQISPAITLEGQGWKTAATAASQSVAYKMYVTPSQGSTAPSGQLSFYYSINGAAYIEQLRLNSSGSLTFVQNSSALSMGTGGSITTATLTSSQIINASRTFLATSSTDGLISENTTSATSVAQTQMSPRLRFSSTAWTGAVSQISDFIIENLPTAGTNPITSALLIKSQINGGGYNTRITLTDGGLVGIGVTPSATLHVAGSGSNPTLKIVAAGTSTNYSIRNFQSDGTTEIFSLKDNGDFQVGISSSKWGMFGTASVSQQSVLGVLVNNVTSGGTTSTIANFTDLVTYSNDAATIRNNDYQLAKKILAIETALRNYGILKD